MSEETCLRSFVFINISTSKCAFLHGKKRQEKWRCTTLLPVARLLKCYSGREEQPSSHSFYTNWNKGFHLGSSFSEGNTVFEVALFLRYHRSCSYFRRKMNYSYLVYHSIFKASVFWWVLSVNVFCELIVPLFPWVCISEVFSCKVIKSISRLFPDIY